MSQPVCTSGHEAELPADRAQQAEVSALVGTHTRHCPVSPTLRVHFTACFCLELSRLPERTWLLPAPVSLCFGTCTAVWGGHLQEHCAVTTRLPALLVGFGVIQCGVTLSP